MVIQFPKSELLWHSTSAAYLMNASGEELLRIKQEEASSISEITAERRIPIQGYGMRMLEELHVQLTKAAIIDTGRYAGGLALICAEHMYDQTRGPNTRRSIVQKHTYLARSLKLILGREIYDKGQISTFQSALRGTPSKKMKPPDSVTDAGKPIAANEWKRLFSIASHLALVMLAFSAVRNLEVCEDLVLTELSKAPKTSSLSIQILQWDGHSPLLVNPTQWYEIVAIIISDRRSSTQTHETSLFSNWGWSVFIDCLGISGECEPFSVEPGRIWVQRGVPYYSEAVAHSIRNSPETFHLTTASQRCEEERENRKARGELGVEFANFMIAHRNDAFVISRRYRTEHSENFPDSVGFGLMSKARWEAYTVDDCDHTGLSEQLIPMGVGTATFKGFQWRNNSNIAPPERVSIALVYRNDHAR